MSAPQVPRPRPRRRLTQAEFEREAARARGEVVVTPPPDGPRRVTPLPDGSEVVEQWERRDDGSYKRMVTRTGRRRSWWQRGWKRGESRGTRHSGLSYLPSGLLVGGITGR